MPVMTYSDPVDTFDTSNLQLYRSISVSTVVQFARDQPAANQKFQSVR